MTITVEASCDNCSGSISTDKYPDSIYCTDCYRELQDKILSLEDDIADLKYNLEEKDGVIETHEQTINILQVNYI